MLTDCMSIDAGKGWWEHAASGRPQIRRYRKAGLTTQY
jgi:hypothetical protein